ncbi:MAG: hypothetical protein JRF63_06195 [Deltaproteobacteria bacterium]|nr:hypothetical protein [Deltaproteobacteria bacterium]
MKIASATIEIRPRKITEMIDLATLFYRTHFRVIFGLLAVLGVPIVLFACGVHYLTGQAWLAILLFWLLLPLPAGAVVLAASRIVFGTHLTVRRALKLYGPLWAGLFLRRLWQNLITLLLMPVIAGFALRLRWAFTPMIVLLERLSGRPLALRRVGLNRRGGASSFGMDLLVGMVCGTLVLSLTIVIELICSDFLSLWHDSGLFSLEVFDDPVRLGLWMLAALLVSPIAHLSWFFFYINARIRGEGWDLELGLKAAAARLPNRREDAA